VKTTSTVVVPVARVVGVVLLTVTPDPVHPTVELPDSVPVPPIVKLTEVPVVRTVPAVGAVIVLPLTGTATDASAPAVFPLVPTVTEHVTVLPATIPVRTNELAVAGLAVATDVVVTVNEAPDVIEPPPVTAQSIVAPAAGAAPPVS
jgi:hypothetical protein